MPTEVHPFDSSARMPYAPAVRVPPGSELLMLSGTTALPLYHDHPHSPDDEHAVPAAIAEQTRLAVDNLAAILDAEGLGTDAIVKLTIYLTALDEIGQVQPVLDEFLDGWRPATTLVEVNRLSAPTTRVELDAIAAKPG